MSTYCVPGTVADAVGKGETGLPVDPSLQGPVLTGNVKGCS